MEEIKLCSLDYKTPGFNCCLIGSWAFRYTGCQVCFCGSYLGVLFCLALLFCVFSFLFVCCFVFCFILLLFFCLYLCFLLCFFCLVILNTHNWNIDNVNTDNVYIMCIGIWIHVYVYVSVIHTRMQTDTVCVCVCVYYTHINIHMYLYLYTLYKHCLC